MGGSREVVGLHTTCQPPIAQFAIYRARCLKIDKKLKLLQLPRLSFSPQLCTEWLRRSCFARENKIFSAARNERNKEKDARFNVSPRETEKIMERYGKCRSMMTNVLSTDIYSGEASSVVYKIYLALRLDCKARSAHTEKPTSEHSKVSVRLLGP